MKMTMDSMDSFSKLNTMNSNDVKPKELLPGVGSFSKNPENCPEPPPCPVCQDCGQIKCPECPVCPKCQELFSIDTLCPAFHDVLDLEKNNFELFSEKEKFDYNSNSHPN